MKENETLLLSFSQLLLKSLILCSLSVPSLTGPEVLCKATGFEWQFTDWADLAVSTLIDGVARCSHANSYKDWYGTTATERGERRIARRKATTATNRCELQCIQTSA